jgi:glycosyltransferase 2 family protein
MSSAVPTGERLERSPADVLRVVAAGAVLLLLVVVRWLFGDDLVSFGSDLLRGFDAFPQWVIDLVVLGTRVLAVTVLVGGLIWSLAHGRWPMLVRVAIAAGAAAVLVALLEAMADGTEGEAVVAVDVEAGPLSAGGFPSTVGIGSVAAALTAAAPWLSRRWRQVGWALISGMVVTRSLTSPLSLESWQAAAVGWLCGAVVLVAMGAPSRRPTRDAVMDGLARVGLPVADLQRAGVDARGSTPYFGVAGDGTRLFVKTLGDDERSADLLFRLYRRLQPRDLGDERRFSSLRRAVEHEALVALAAASVGVRTPQLRAFAHAEPNGYVLAYDAIAGRSLDQLDPGDVTDAVLDEIWGLVAQLQHHRMAHRDLRLANIFLDDARRAWLIDFGFSELAASDLLLATDVAELVASSSICVGARRAIAHATASTDPQILARAVQRLRPWALSGATRAAHKARPGLLDELRAGMVTVG